MEQSTCSAACSASGVTSYRFQKEGPPSKLCMRYIRLMLSFATGAFSAATCLPQLAYHAESNQTSRLEDWLKLQGAQITKVTISESHRYLGKGMFSKEDIPFDAVPSQQSELHIDTRTSLRLGFFPLDTALTFETPFRDPVLRYYMDIIFKELELSPAVVLAVYILFHRKLGDRSPLKEWISSLPDKVQTPLHYSPDQMDELKQTTLRTAVSLMKADMISNWTKLKPIFGQMCIDLNLEDFVSMADFLWAVSIVWSRLMELPEGIDGKGPHLGIVPGIDFINHSSSPNCRWDVKKHNSRFFCELNAVTAIAMGEELTIGYGDRSNEEFLFLYGFVEDLNPNDVLRIHLQHEGPPTETDYIVLPGTESIAAAKDLVKEASTEEDLMKVIPSRVRQSINISEDMTNSQLIAVMRELLQTHLEKIEGPDGTGPLEEDLRLIVDFGLGTEEAWRWNVYVYRSIQKSLTREWLQIARQIEYKLAKIKNH